MDPFYMALLLYFAAAALAVVDLFVPSGGLLVIMAAVGGIGAVLFGFRSGTNAGMGMLTLVIASIPVFAVVAIKIWPHTPMGKRIILKLPAAPSSEATSAADSLQALVGQVLRAETAFLPTGQIRVGHRRFNAVAESGLIEAGGHVKVVAVRERNLIVRATTAPLSKSTAPPGQQIHTAEQTTEDGGSLLDRPAEELGLDSLDN